MPDTKDLIDALASHLGESLGAMTGMAVRIMPTAGEATIDWHVPVTVGGSATGTVWLGLSQAGATELVAGILGDPASVTDAAIADTLKELFGQSAAAHVLGAGPGLSLTIETPEPSTSPVQADAQHYDVMVGTSDPIRLAGWGRTTAGTSPDSLRSARSAPLPAPPSVGLASAVTPTSPRNLDVVLDIELPITVRFGETQMTLGSLARLGPGSMIDLARSPDDPVDLLVNGRLVARGEVVVVSGCYGVRVNEVVSPADRLRSLEL